MKKIYRYLTHGALLAAVFVVCGSASSPSGMASAQGRVLIINPAPHFVRQLKSEWCVFACILMWDGNTGGPQCYYATKYAGAHRSDLGYWDCCDNGPDAYCNIGVHSDYVVSFMAYELGHGRNYLTAINLTEFGEKIDAIPDQHWAEFCDCFSSEPMFLVFPEGEGLHCNSVTKIDFSNRIVHYLDPARDNRTWKRPFGGSTPFSIIHVNVL